MRHSYGQPMLALIVLKLFIFATFVQTPYDEAFYGRQEIILDNESSPSCFHDTAVSIRIFTVSSTVSRKPGRLILNRERSSTTWV